MKLPKTLDELWSDLLEDKPTATQALLAMSMHPTEVTQFLEAKLVPLRLSREQLVEYIENLSSHNEDEWKEAVRKLEYFDPRLAMGLQELLSLKSVQTFPARHRLVDVLSGRQIDSPNSATARAFQFVNLYEMVDEGYNFRCGDDENSCLCSWWAEHRIDRLNDRFGNPKPEWTRIIRSLALLQSFDTSAARSIIATVASGHPDSQPTRIAMEFQANRENQ